MFSYRRLLYVIHAAIVAVWFIFILPNYFRGEWEIPGGVAVGALFIRFYGLLQAIALVVGYYVVLRLARRVGMADAAVERFLWFVVPAAYIGARLYFVIFSWSYYAQDWSKILAVWEGGLAIHGALIGGAVGVWLFARINRLPFLSITDLLVPALALGQAIGRWGNFFNQEAFGAPTALPWKMFVDQARRPAEFVSAKFFHPTFLYESLWDALLFVLLWLVWRKPLQKPGLATAVYVGLYSVGRFFIEMLRTDSLFVGDVRVAQAVSVVGVVIAAVIVVERRRKT